jgi:hypothetical protein
MNNAQLKQDILSVFKPIIASWTEPDIYAISFRVQDDGDNPCEPTVTLGYNTERQFVEEKRQFIEEKRQWIKEFPEDCDEVKTWSEEGEPRWNFCYWLQNDLFEYGRGDTKENIINWVKGNGFHYYHSYDDIPNGYEGVEKLHYITMAFIEILIDVVKELHKSSFIQEKFGKSIPILIHELEYYDQIADQNIEANTLLLVNDFVAWIRNQ